MYTPRKELGQNFLLDPSIVDKLISSMNLQATDTVIEIGPGLGALTFELAKRLDQDRSLVYAVEVDVRFVERLKYDTLPYMNVNVLHADILEWLPDFVTNKPFKILGSLPYYITSPIIHTIVQMQQLPSLCVLLIQKEVAERISAKAPDSSYMSVYVQTFFDVEYLGLVDRKKFNPEPKVDGGILRLTLKEDHLISRAHLERYEGFLHRCFNTPRKMLNKVLNKEELAKTGVDGNLRPQNLSAEEWARVFNVLNG